MKIFSLLKNKIFLFLSSRIITYLIQFINTLYIAIVLGPSYLGIWGFITMIILYCQFFNMGIPLALNVNLSRNYKNQSLSSNTFSQSLIISIVWSVIICLIICVIFNFDISYFKKYNANEYYIFICVIVVLIHFNSLYMNMYRVAGKLFKVAFFQTSVQFSFLIVLLSSLWIKIENNKLLILLLTVYIIAEFISLLLFVIRSPLKPKLFNSRVISIKEMKDSFIQGVNLLLYNVSFHFMILGTKTIISYFYTVEEFGFFAFSWNLAQATIMILQIVSFILYPKMLNKFSLLDNKKIYDLISSVKNVYVSISFLFVYIAFTIIFVLIKIFPKYESAFPLFIILSLSVSLYNFSFGSSTYLIARKKETILSWYSFISCIICICIALLLSLLKIAYIYVGLSIFISYCVMTITVNRKVYNLLNDKENLSHSIKEFFSYKIWIPIIATLLIIQINNSIFYFIPLLLFIFLNFKMLIDSAKLTKNMLNNSNLLKL